MGDARWRGRTQDCLDATGIDRGQTARSIGGLDCGGTLIYILLLRAIAEDERADHSQDCREHYKGNAHSFLPTQSNAEFW